HERITSLFRIYEQIPSIYAALSSPPDSENPYARAVTHCVNGILDAGYWSGSAACQIWQRHARPPNAPLRLAGADRLAAQWRIMQPREGTARAVFENFIDGTWAASSSGRLFENRNPANHDDLIGVFQESTAGDAERAISAAERAYAGWRLVPAPRRAEMLFRAAQLIADRKEQFA